MSIGGRASESNSYQQGTSEGLTLGGSQGSTFVDPNQQPYLEAMREAALSGYNQSAPNMSGLGNVAGNVGTEALGNLGQLGNAQGVIDAQLTGLQSGLGELQSQGLNQIGDNAIASGAFGGGRHGLAESSLRGEIGDAYTRGYGDIMANASNQAIGANQAALAGGGQVLGNQMLADFGGLQALSGILGNPTLLSDNSSFNLGQNQSQYTGQSSDESAGFSFGYK